LAGVGWRQDASVDGGLVRLVLGIALLGVVALSACAGPARVLAPAPFDRTLTQHGVGFRVVSANRGSINRLEIIPSGPAIDRAPIAREIDGTVSGATIGDLDDDGSPEVYVFVTSAGSGSYGSLVAYRADQRRSLSEVLLPPIGDHAAASKGYQGHDSFTLAEGRLVRRFPVYRTGDVNAVPTGGRRELQYRLTQGPAGWQLELVRIVDD
jgi:hypothetical protein